MRITRQRIASSSNPSVDYIVTLVDGLSVACTCPHFQYRAGEDTPLFVCKHMNNAYVKHHVADILFQKGASNA